MLALPVVQILLYFNYYLIELDSKKNKTEKKQTFLMLKK